MARINLTDKVNELSALVETLAEQVGSLRQEVERLGTEQGKTADSLADVRIKLDTLRPQLGELKGWKESVGPLDELKIKIGLLLEWKDEIKKKGEEWGRRLWLLVPVIMGAILTFLLGYYFGKK